MTRHITATALAFAAGQLLAPPSWADQRSPYGVVAGPGDLANDPNKPSAATLLSQLGAGWVRAAWTWDLVELTYQGDYRWDGPDRMVADLAARDIWIYWDFSYAPCWANGRPCHPEPNVTVGDDRYYAPLNQSQLYSYVFNVVSHYKQLGYTNIVWGGWNEVDGIFYNPTSNPSSRVNHYVNNTLPTIVDAIRAADPNARIAMGELSTAADANHIWLKQILDKVSGKFQYISLHIYGKETGSPGTCGVRVGKVDSWHGDLTSWGYAQPTWVTESGGGLSDFGGTVQGQTGFMQCFWAAMQVPSRVSWWTKTFWYNLQPPADGSQTGLLDGPAGGPYTANARYTGYQAALASVPQISFTNRSFELGSGTDASNWVEAPGHTRASDYVVDGSWSMKSTYTGPGTASYQAVNVQPTEAGQAPNVLLVLGLDLQRLDVGLCLLRSE